MRRAVLALPIALLLVGAAAAPAAAQAPGQTPPLGTASSEYHAVPPLPRVYPSPMPSAPPPARVSGEIGDPGGWAYQVGGRGWSASIGEDGRIHFDDESLGAGAGASPLYGLLAWLQFDTTDAIMRAARQDPYLAAKLAAMDETRPQRMELRARHDRLVMDRALAHLPAYLAAVWREAAWSPAERRRILFALWDEAAEDGNELLRAGGAEARCIIERFIAQELPPGSRHAFAPAELAALNRIRSSRQPFAPYEAARRAMASARPPRPAPPPAVALVAALRSF
ncbi:MAG TPA: hypothetical protein VKZ63_14710 [Kofleriaceae bacterium]|nr:hypothetical protein [Kofleriaceae bacterium]